jgi:ParB family chromosome partitioning protein
VPTTPQGSSRGLLLIPIEQIEPNPFQPRRAFHPEGIAELAASIREKGIIQPIMVRPQDGGYQLVAGERRFRAAQEAGLQSIPAVVREISDLQSLELALIENIQRRDLSPIERARAYRQLMERFGYSQSDLARHLSLNRASVANTLRLLALPEPVQSMVDSGALSMGHAKALLSMAPGTALSAMAERAIREDLSVRELERMSQRQPRRRVQKPEVDPNLQAIETRMQESLGTRVRLRYKQGKGRVEIDFFSDEDLQRIIDVLGVSMS